MCVCVLTGCWSLRFSLSRDYPVHVTSVLNTYMAQPLVLDPVVLGSEGGKHRSVGWYHQWRSVMSSFWGHYCCTTPEPCCGLQHRMATWLTHISTLNLQGMGQLRWDSFSGIFVGFNGSEFKVQKGVSSWLLFYQNQLTIPQLCPLPLMLITYVGSLQAFR